MAASECGLANVGDPGWEHFAHGADIGIRGVGATMESAFEQAAMALTGVVTDPAAVRAQTAVGVSCTAPDDETLLVDWLNAVIYEMTTRRMLFGAFAVRIIDGQLRGILWGEPVDVSRHEPAVEVKGATYTALRVAREESGLWVARCVVDV